MVPLTVSKRTDKKPGAESSIASKSNKEGYSRHFENIKREIERDERLERDREKEERERDRESKGVREAFFGFFCFSPLLYEKKVR